MYKSKTFSNISEMAVFYNEGNEIIYATGLSCIYAEKIEEPDDIISTISVREGDKFTKITKFRDGRTFINDVEVTG